MRRVTGGNEALADDLAQEACIEAYRNLAKFKGDSAFETWLLGIGYNRFRQWCRKRRETPVAEVPDRPDERTGTSDSDTNLDIREAVGRLRTEERTALELCYGRGLSHGDAADILGCPVGTLKTHILRAKEKLRILLAAYSAGA